MRLHAYINFTYNFFTMMKTLRERVADTLNQIKYPPVNPTLTKDDIIELLADIRTFLDKEIIKKESLW